MSVHRIRRRDWLAGLGLAGGSLFLPSLLDRGRASAQTTEAPPKRLILFSTMHGTLLERWRMGQNMPNDQDWELPLANMTAEEFSPILRPLHDLRADMTVVDGLSMHSAMADPQEDVGHHVGHANQWTGSFIKWGSGGIHRSTAPSLDQVVAKAIARPDRIPSLELGMPALWGTSLFGFDGIRIEMDDNLPRIFTRLFPMSFNPGGPLTDADRINMGKSSMLDLVAGRHDALSKRLSGADASKVAMHRDLVRMLEKRIAGALSLAGCARPGTPPKLDRQAPDYYRKTWSTFLPIVAAALACDLTRVVTLQPSDYPDRATLDGFGFAAGKIVHDFAHEVPTTIGSMGGKPDSKDKMTMYYQYLAGMLHDLVALLKSIPEGNGTMLDNCLVVWASEIGNGMHYFYDWPVVMFGSAGGQVRTGRYIKFGQTIPNSNALAGMNFPKTFGPPHNRFLTSAANLVGAAVPGMGMASVRGAKWTANPVDCSGSLPRLT